MRHTGILLCTVLLAHCSQGVPYRPPAQIRRPVYRDNVHLKWVRWSGSLPEWAVSVYNERADRTDYICAPLSGCYWSSGHYNPTRGPYCYNPCHGTEGTHQQFDVLVNEQNLADLEWKNVSYGEMPLNSVGAYQNQFVAKNDYGIGTIYSNIFYVPWNGTELSFTDGHKVLLLSSVRSVHIYNVEYNTSQMEALSQRHVLMAQTSVINQNCDKAKTDVNMNEPAERQSSWEVSYFTALPESTSITAGIPLISQNFGITADRTFPLSQGKPVTEKITHSLSVSINVPPTHTCSVKMEGKQYKVDIPFTAKLRKTSQSGTIDTKTVTGIYHGTQVGKISGVIDRCVPIPDSQPCEG